METLSRVLVLIFVIYRCAANGKFGAKDCEALRTKLDHTCATDLPPVTRIVGGRKAKPDEAKFMVHIGYGAKNTLKYQCGGSLIHERWVLSAAHCSLPKRPGTPSFVRLFNSNEDLPVQQAIGHPKFAAKKSYYDILLIQLKEPVRFDCKVQPVCLQTELDIRDKKASILGWGRTGLDSDPSEHLLTANVLFFNNTMCNKLYSSVKKLAGGMLEKGIRRDLQICAGTLSGKKDTCLGDSGGPLVISKKRSQLRTQVGITSFGYGCGTAGYPGVYTRVSQFITWIESVVNKNM